MILFNTTWPTIHGCVLFYFRREAYAPDIDNEKFPAAQHMHSIHNTPIEGLWHWFLITFGLNIKDIIRQGYLNGIYNPNNPVHLYVIFFVEKKYYSLKFSKLFNWLWPKILQAQLDKFVEYWNNHKIHHQKDKPNMSGQSPRHAFTVLQPPAEDCRIPVDQVVINALCSQIPISREDSMRWVDDTFEQASWEAYAVLGQPSLNSLDTAWSVFESLAPLISVDSQ